MVIHQGRVVSRGYNCLKTHPRLFKKYGYFSIHAECDAIMRANRGDTLVVVRVLKSGKLTCAKPCEKCLTFAKEYGIRKIMYSDWDESIKEMRL